MLTIFFQNAVRVVFVRNHGPLALKVPSLRQFLITYTKFSFICTGKKCNLIDLQRQELERIVNLSDEALRLRVMNLHNFVFTRKQREEKKKHDEMRAKGA